MSFSEFITFYPEWNFDLFLLINSKWSHTWLDTVLPLLRNKYFWVPLYVFLSSFLVVNYRVKGVLGVVFCFIVFAFTNTLSAEMMKPVFKQDRPCRSDVFKEHVIVRVHCGPGKSFPSAHATNHFGLSVFFSVIFFRRFKWTVPWFLLWAAAVSYAQVYVGVHYPVDVIIGALLGGVIGIGVGLTYNRFFGF